MGIDDRGAGRLRGVFGASRTDLGRAGEASVERFLIGRGHEVLARRFRVRHGEVDLISRRGRHLYFIEVKTRSRATDAFGGGLESLTPRKLERLARVAECWLARERCTGVPHLALAVVVPSDGGCRIHFLPDIGGP